MQYGLPEALWERVAIETQHLFKLRVALEHIDEIFEKLKGDEDLSEEEYVEEAPPKNTEDDQDVVDDDLEEVDPLSPIERKFYEAYSTRWIHADKRKFLAEYISNLIINALG